MQTLLEGWPIDGSELPSKRRSLRFKCYKIGLCVRTYTCRRIQGLARARQLQLELTMCAFCVFEGARRRGNVGSSRRFQAGQSPRNVVEIALCLPTSKQKVASET